MYKIIRSNGEALGYAESVVFTKKKGVNIIEAKPEDAAGIAYRSTAYNLAGTEGVGAAETVSVYAVDGGEAITDADAKTAENAEAVAALEDAMCEADTANEEWKAGIEDALCEISAESEE